MNILFVYSLEDVQSVKKPLRRQDQVQLGLSYISSFLKKHNHITKLVVLCKLFGKKNIEILDEYIKNFSPELICFSSLSNEYDFIAKTGKYIKNRYPKIYLLIGGCHVSLNPENVLLDSFDALCIGEGEMPTFELISQLEKGLCPSRIPNLWIKGSQGIEKNSTRPFLQDLDSLPFPDREMWQCWIDEQLGTYISLLLGRGCSFECTYCCNHALKRLSSGPYVRFRSSDNILDELKHIAARFPEKKVIDLEVESFGINIRWALELCAKLENFNKTLKEPFLFGVNLRVIPGIDYDGLFAALRRANFSFINIGLESGSEKVRREILNRYYRNKDIVNVVRLARKYNLKVNLYNLIGVPGETLADFRETVDLNRACLPDRHYTSIFFPYPGTKLYLLCKERGLLKKGLKIQMDKKEAVLDLPGFTKKEIKKSLLWFDYYVYRGYVPAYKILIRVIVLKFTSNIFFNLIFRKLVKLPVLRRLRYVLLSR